MDVSDVSEDSGTPIAWCESETQQIYDPLTGAEIGSFPDDFYTRDDETPTGLRVELTDDYLSWSPAVCGGVMEIFLELLQRD